MARRRRVVVSARIRDFAGHISGKPLVLPVASRKQCTLRSYCLPTKKVMPIVFVWRQTDLTIHVSPQRDVMKHEEEEGSVERCRMRRKRCRGQKPPYKFHRRKNRRNRWTESGLAS